MQESIDLEYQNLLNGEISPEDYMQVTEVTSSQVTAQISEFVTSKPPEEWQEKLHQLYGFNEEIQCICW